MEHIMELVRSRKSVRTFTEKEITPDHREALCAFMEKIENPWGIAVTFRLLEAKEHGLSSPVIAGASLYVGAKVARVPCMEEAFGYSFETLVLFARSLGIGTTWIGGTMDRPAFERAMALTPEERMPCVSPLGYPAAKPSMRETMMRKAIRADSRQPFTELFFDGAWDVPLTPEAAGALYTPLEAVRLGPSAVNKQPWRVLRTGDTFHFYEKKSRGYVSDATGDLQRIDLGIALCHFAISAAEQGLTAVLSQDGPDLAAAGDMAYIASFRVAH